MTTALLYARRALQAAIIVYCCVHLLVTCAHAEDRLPVGTIPAGTVMTSPFIATSPWVASVPQRPRCPEGYELIMLSNGAPVCARDIVEPVR